MDKSNVYDPEKCRACGHNQCPERCKTDMCSNLMQGADLIMESAMKTMVFKVIDNAGKQKKEEVKA